MSSPPGTGGGSPASSGVRAGGYVGPWPAAKGDSKANRKSPRTTRTRRRVFMAAFLPRAAQALLFSLSHALHQEYARFDRSCAGKWSFLVVGLRAVRLLPG